MKDYDFSKYEDRLKFYQSKEWKDIRAFILSQHPVCVKCMSNDKITPANEVDHILPLRKYPELRFDSRNLAPLCRPCHSQKTYEETLAKTKKWEPFKLIWKRDE